MTDSAATSAHFDVHPSVVFRLGEELVSDPIQAIIELVKNSYDAGSKSVDISISTIPALAPESRVQKKHTWLVIQDFGDGMTREQLERGWLVIANSTKRDQKRKGLVPSDKVTPLGDKGLGRLGVQKIGKTIEVVTRSDKNRDIEHYLYFDWEDFEKAERLSDIPIKLHSTPGWRSTKPGTTIIISGLRDIEYWNTESAKKKLGEEISKMITPFPEIKTCKVTLKIDGEVIPLIDVTTKIRERAPVRYGFTFDGAAFTLTGSIKLDFFKPKAQQIQDLRQFEAYVMGDKGKGLFEYFVKNKMDKKIPGLLFDKKGDAFITFKRVWNLETMDGLRKNERGELSPGPFKGELNFLNLDDNSPNRVYEKKADLQKITSAILGVRLYRDGFGIRVDDDWLHLGKSFTSSGGFYSLRPGNVLGYVALTASGNPNLLETTSREGLIRNAECDNFNRILAAFVKFANKTQNDLRRTAKRYIEARRLEGNGVSPEDDTEVIVDKLKVTAEKLQKTHQALKKKSARLSHSSTTGATLLEKKGGATPVAKFAPADFDREVKETLELVAEASVHLNDYLSLQEVIKARENHLKEQISQVYQTVSLGITAESLAHEINHIVSDLLSRAIDLDKYMSSKSIKDTKIIVFLEHVRSTATGLRKQLSFLTPSLRYVRESRERLNVITVLNELCEHYQSRFKSDNISMKVNNIDATKFNIKINRGKFNQIFENLLLNSRFWVLENIRKNKVNHGEITIEVEHPVVRVWDNGPGVDPAISESLFEAFMTTRQDGRGLGLFVVQQLLDSEDCVIDLLQKRNKSGRQFTFELDFRGALDGGN